MGSEGRKVKDIMCHLNEYEMVDAEAPLCEFLGRLKESFEQFKAGKRSHFHKTMLVTGPDGKVIGKLSSYDFIKGLVPEPAQKKELSRAFYSLVSSRALEVADQVHEFQKSFQWLHNSFSDLVKQESHKKAKDIMAPALALLNEDDTINKAIHVMFTENVRQPFVKRGDEIIGVLRLLDVFNELVDIAGDECLFTGKK